MVNSVTFYGNNILLPYTQVLKLHFSLSFLFVCFSSVDIQYLVL